jgi:G protein-coupled receptor 158
VLRGEGDKWDHRSRARGITASFCINGGGLMPDEGVDLYQENEELKVKLNINVAANIPIKTFVYLFNFFLHRFCLLVIASGQEQISKLAGQVEFMKIVQMEVNNRHLKPKPGGYFTIQSPLGKSLTASRKQHHHTAPSSTETSKHENSVIEDGHSGTNSAGGVRWAIKIKRFRFDLI